MTTQNSLTAAIAAAQQADDAWQAALEEAYGRHAGDARYDTRGVSTPALAALAERKIETCRNMSKKWAEHRAEQSDASVRLEPGSVRLAA